MSGEAVRNKGASVGLHTSEWCPDVTFVPLNYINLLCYSRLWETLVVALGNSYYSFSNYIQSQTNVVRQKKSQKSLKYFMSRTRPLIIVFEVKTFVLIGFYYFRPLGE